jgi:CheY-like chemotaxis protein
MKTGFDAYLPKPVRREKLLDVMAQLLGDKGREGRHNIDGITRQRPVREATKQPVRILVAEDHPVNQQLVMLKLTKEGYQVELAGNGREAVERLAAAPDSFDLVLMDIQMPEMDGYAATRAIREMGLIHLPVIAFTAHAMMEEQEKCIACGMNDYVSKPIKWEVVLEKITDWVHDRRGSDDDGEVL